METYKLERVYLPTQTLGSIYDTKGNLICKTMELPWLENKSNVSCIPEGSYLIHKQEPSFGRKYGYFRFDKVQNRGMNQVAKKSTILIHRITYVKDLRGCIGVGGRFVDLNKDGDPDMVDSGKKLQWMYENLPDQFILEIVKKSA
jgi:hypothetical protein